LSNVIASLIQLLFCEHYTRALSVIVSKASEFC